MFERGSMYRWDLTGEKRGIFGKITDRHLDDRGTPIAVELEFTRVLRGDHQVLDREALVAWWYPWHRVERFQPIPDDVVNRVNGNPR